MRRLFNLPIHQFLFAIFPVLSLFFHNRDEVSYYEAVLPFFASAAGALLFFLFLSFVIKNYKKAGIITSLFILFFFSFGAAYGYFFLGFARTRYILALWLLLFFLSAYFIWKTKKDLDDVTRALNIASIVLMAMPLGALLWYESRIAFSAVSGDPKARQNESRAAYPEYNSGRGAPDIYYIVLDAYANEKTLKELYGYDNKEFIDYLTGMGFHVVRESRSNYPHTSLSLASTLNMKYVNYLVEEYNGDYPKIANALKQLIEDSEVARILKHYGYSVVHLSSGWGETNYNRRADLSFRVDNSMDPFSILVLKTTVLGPVYQRYFTYIQRERVLYTFKTLREMPRLPGPKFIFAHILSPHPPFVFKQNGEEVPNGKYMLEGDIWKQKEQYLDQLIFINQVVKETLREIISADSDAIILIQSDHGTSTLDKQDASAAAFFQERMRNFNAYRLPGISGVEERATNVNTFRIILNEQFGFDFDFLEDRSYYSDSATAYDLIDVTDKADYH
ncbi:MAG: sulfatase-like hydrolase/transferase [Candidatus Giovannonibacteria bacterium]|nr:MAG: sulfatase-like hydrolase/transferase [Candidatus Giovannonibacteria bacterium]